MKRVGVELKLFLSSASQKGTQQHFGLVDQCNTLIERWRVMGNVAHHTF